MRRLGGLALAVLASCSSGGLTLDQARPFQSCVQDSDCTVDSLSCGTCSTAAAVGVARSQQVAFEEARGCWPPSSDPDPCSFFGCSSGLGVCRGGACAAITTCAPSSGLGAGSIGGFTSGGSSSGTVGSSAGSSGTGTIGGGSTSVSSAGSGTTGGSDGGA